MILINKNLENEYGVVHQIDSYSFIGFCKNLENNKNLEIDVLINNNKIDTIIPNTHNEYLETIYNLNDLQSCFFYSLKPEYITEGIELQFKIKNTNISLINSPFSIDPSYFRYLSFENSFNKEIQSMASYAMGTIGFFATNENIKNENFINFIIKLSQKIPTIQFKGFYFANEQKIYTDNILNKTIKNFELINAVNYHDITEQVEFFVGTNLSMSDIFVKNISMNFKNIILLHYPDKKEFSETKLNNLIDTELAIKTLYNLGFTKEIIEKYNNKFIITAWNDFIVNNNYSNYTLDHNITYESFLIDIIELSLNHAKYKEHLSNILLTYFRTIKLID